MTEKTKTRFGHFTRRTRGVLLIWGGVALVVLVGICTLAMDLGRILAIKSEMQNAADATALGALAMYQQNGLSSAYYGTSTVAAMNPVDVPSGVACTYVYTWGTWDQTTRVLTPGYGSGTPAIRVDISRTKANNNPVSLIFGQLIGVRTCDVHASATATLVGGESGTVAVPAIANPYLAGMPSGTATAWSDNTANATPYKMTSVPVTPGTWITIANTSGTSCIVPGQTGDFGAEGESTRMLHHGENYNGDDWNVGPENGIADAVLPAAALTGVFLTSAAPNTKTAPATVDWSSSATRDQPIYDDIVSQQPFFIGDGKTSDGTVQKFMVPPDATRLYLAIWDGVTQSNNSGSISASIGVRSNIRLVK